MQFSEIRNFEATKSWVLAKQALINGDLMQFGPCSSAEYNREACIYLHLSASASSAQGS